MEGFVPNSLEEIRNLKEILDKSTPENLEKTLEAGQGIIPVGAPAGVTMDAIAGSALKPEYLDALLHQLTIQEKHLGAWVSIPKREIPSPVFEYNVVTEPNQAPEETVTITETASPIEDYANYTRKVAVVSYFAVQKKVGLGLLQANAQTLHNVSKMGALTILKALDKNIYWGSTQSLTGGYSTEFDGLYRLIPKENIIDAKGSVLDESFIIEASKNIVQKGYGIAEVALMSPNAKNSIGINRLGDQRYFIPPSPAYNGVTLGFNPVEVRVPVQDSPISLTVDLMLGKRQLAPNQAGAYGVADKVNSVTVSATTGDDVEAWKNRRGDVESVLGSGADGYYFVYGFRVKSRGGVSEVKKVVVGAIEDDSSGDTYYQKGIQFTLNLSGTNAVKIIVYRSKPLDYDPSGNIDAVPLYEVAYITDPSTLSGTTVTWVDKHEFWADTETVWVGQLSDTTEIGQFISLARIPLANLGAYVAFMIFSADTLMVYSPYRWSLIKNVRVPNVF